jgi:alkanesulfonate monooxygenase SsuD/methylene tetrahydromethanopterin reductase-like flavin-dependent oxidoreductase (luciferase family)
MLVDVQFSSAHNDWPALRDAVLRAEASGTFDTTWVFDHFDGSTLGGTHQLLECCTLLGALASATSTIGLGSMVLNVANRHPAVAAAAMHSVQRISGGRLRVGIGAGTAPGTPWAAEHDRRGIDLAPALADRHAGVRRQIEVMRDTCAVPIIVGTNTVALSALAGQLADGLNVRLEHPRAAEFITAARTAAAHRPFEISAYTIAEDSVEIRQLAAELGIDRLVLTHLGPVR